MVPSIHRLLLAWTRGCLTFQAALSYSPETLLRLHQVLFWPPSSLVHAHGAYSLLIGPLIRRITRMTNASAYLHTALQCRNIGSSAGQAGARAIDSSYGLESGTTGRPTTSMPGSQLPVQQVAKPIDLPISGPIPRPTTIGASSSSSHGPPTRPPGAIPQRPDGTGLAETIRPKAVNSSLRPATSASPGELERLAQPKDAAPAGQQGAVRVLQRAGRSLPQPTQRAPEIQPLSPEQSPERPARLGQGLSDRAAPLAGGLGVQQALQRSADDTRGTPPTQLSVTRDNLRQLAARRPQNGGAVPTPAEQPARPAEPEKKRQDGLKQN